jgi:Leucine-rich repeat (LRR) protein
MAGPARKWYVLSLRGAMLLVLACGLWMGWRVNRANDQRRAVAAIVRAGGGVSYDHQGRPWAPDWLRKRLGDEFFQDVTAVQFIDKLVTDHDLAPLASFDRLEEFSISGAPITDAGLKHLSKLTSLRILSLWDTPGVTDAGLAHLAALTKLQTLNLYRCDITDAGLVHLRWMTNLEALFLSKTKVTGPGLSHLGRMSKLKSLFTPTNSAGLTHIGRLSSLRELYAYDTASPTPSDGLAQLAGLKGLSVLILGDNLCSASGLTQIAGHTGLTRLEIGGDGVTDAELVHVARIKGLQQLTVHKSKITGSGLVGLEGLSSLTFLDLQDSAGVGNDGVEHLKKLSSIQTLGLGGTNVSDAGLAQLNGLKSLGRLVVGRGVTPAGITAIRQALPTIVVVR